MGAPYKAYCCRPQQNMKKHPVKGDNFSYAEYMSFIEPCRWLRPWRASASRYTWGSELGSAFPIGGATCLLAFCAHITRAATHRPRYASRSGDLRPCVPLHIGDNYTLACSPSQLHVASYRRHFGVLVSVGWDAVLRYRRGCSRLATIVTWPRSTKSIQTLGVMPPYLN